MILNVEESGKFFKIISKSIVSFESFWTVSVGWYEICRFIASPIRNLVMKISPPWLEWQSQLTGIDRYLIFCCV